MVTGHRKPHAGDHSVWNRELLDSHPEMSAEVLWAKRVRNILLTLPADKWIKKQALLGSGLHLPDACVLNYNIFLLAFKRYRHSFLYFSLPQPASTPVLSLC